MTEFKSKHYELQLLLFLFLSIVPWSAAHADISEALKRNATAIIYFMVAFAYVVGFWFVVSSFMELKKYGQSRSMMPMNIDIMGPLARMIIGLALLFLPQTLGILANSMWGNTDIASSIEYIRDDGGKFSDLALTSKYLIRAIGYISLVRGLIMLNRVTHQGSQPGTVGKAAGHIIGGIFAINIEATYSILKHSMGVMS